MGSITYCTVEGCESRCWGNGLCSKHYQRLRRRGDLTTDRIMGKGDTTASKFWSRVALTADIERCWEWQGRAKIKGYGIISVDTHKWLTHHYAWFLVKGQKAEEQLLHSCDNRLCVNPNHLREGTQKENVFDMMSRKRSAGYSMVKQDVIDILTYLDNGKNAFQIHKMTNIHYHSIRAVRDGWHWSLGLLEEA